MSKSSVSDEQKLFTISRGESTFGIANKLQAEGIIKSKYVFVWLAFINRDPIQTGTYLANSGENVKDIYNKIISGDSFEKKVTIPEGWRMEQIAQLLHNEGIVDFDIFIKESSDLEGRLFPDTYFVIPDETVASIIGKMTQNFNKQIGQNVSDQQLTVASLVEREAKDDEDRPLIASVFYNRLKINMRLQADPTVQFAKDSKSIVGLSKDEISKFQFWKPITAQDLKTVSSLYNTYANSGLPPGPISNPGKKSILASLSPAESEYLYFVSGDDGQTFFAKTLEEHNENINKIRNSNF